MKTTSKIYDLVYIAVGTVLIIICSWISIPAVVPFTLQTFAVFAVISMIGGKRGTISVLIYIILGAIGVPVFHSFTGGIGILIGTTGGYIIGFIFMGLIFWASEVLFKEKITSLKVNFKNIAARAVTMIIGLIVCYAFGTAWFIVAYARSNEPVGFGTALVMCVIPFIIPDLAKMAVAILISLRVRKLLKIPQITAA